MQAMNDTSRDAPTVIAKCSEIGPRRVDGRQAPQRELRPWIDECSRPDGADEHEHDRNQNQDSEDTAENERKTPSLAALRMDA